MADFEYVTQTGVIVPDTSTVQEDVRNEYRTALGEDLDVSPETPQGVLITAETLARDSVVRFNAALANQINPNIAGGVFLDAIWSLTGGERVAATPTLVRDVTLTGVPGAIVPAGSLAALGTDGARFQLISGVVLTGGTGLGTFQAVEVGAISVAIGELNSIITPVLGWETVNNTQAGETGSAEESDIAARTRRRQTLALQGVALPEAIISGLNTVTGVRSLSFRENVTNAPITIEGVTLAAHSVYACVDGGTDNDVAMMLLRKKSLGAGWNGSTVVDVTEPYSGQVYEVKFDRPEIVQIFVRVTVVPNGASYPDIPGLVRASMVAYADGLQEGEQGFVVGGDVSPFELAAAVGRVAAPLYVRSITLSTDGVTYSAAEIPITIAQKGGLLAGDIAVTVATS